LHFAAYKGCTAVVRLLLDEGVNVNAKTSSGRTPLDDAKEKGKKEVVKLLIQAGGRRGRKGTFCWF
jgi:ankyrin repeat protein